MSVLIVQGTDVETRDLKELAQQCSATGITQISPDVFSLADAHPETALATFCETRQLDCALMEHRQPLRDFGLFVMDMDSTLICIECIDEIADHQGLKVEVAEITASAMRGEIEFAESLRRRVRLLAGLDEAVLDAVYRERLRLNPGAETLLAALKHAGVKTLLVSGGFTFFTDRLQARLGLDYARANTLEIVDGKLTGKVLGNIVDAQAKTDALIEIRDSLGLTPDQVIAVGDGANDLKMMHEAGISIAYHAKPVVQAQATYALNFSGLDGILALFGD